MGRRGVYVENSRRNPSGLALGWGALVEMMWTDGKKGIPNILKETLNALGNRRVNSIISKQSLLLGKTQISSCSSLAAQTGT